MHHLPLECLIRLIVRTYVRMELILFRSPKNLNWSGENRGKTLNKLKHRIDPH